MTTRFGTVTEKYASKSPQELLETFKRSEAGVVRDQCALALWEPYEPEFEQYMGNLAVGTHVPTSGELDEVLSEIFMVFVNSLTRLDNPSKLGPWIQKLARDVVIDWRRDVIAEFNIEAGEQDSFDAISSTPVPPTPLEDYYMRRKARGGNLLYWEGAEKADTEIELARLPDPVLNSEEAMVEAERQSEAKVFLARIIPNERHRDIYLMSSEGICAAEIADKWRITAQSVHNIVSITRRKVIRALAG